MHQVTDIVLKNYSCVLSRVRNCHSMHHSPEDAVSHLANEEIPSNPHHPTSGFTVVSCLQVFSALCATCHTNLTISNKW